MGIKKMSNLCPNWNRIQRLILNVFLLMGLVVKNLDNHYSISINTHNRKLSAQLQNILIYQNKNLKKSNTFNKNYFHLMKHMSTADVVSYILLEEWQLSGLQLLKPNFSTISTSIA
jgi:hypothetical protein